MNLNEYLIESINEIINSEKKLSKKGIEKLVRIQEKIKASDKNNIIQLQKIIGGLLRTLFFYKINK